MQNKNITYNKILSKNKNKQFYLTAQDVLSKPCRYHGSDKVLFETSVFVTAPVLVSYVLWILENAAEKKINKLYFLARDGFVLKLIADVICEARQIPIERKYFYCSRYALRAPMFDINFQEAMEKISMNGVCVTPDNVLKRAGLLDEERNRILDAIGGFEKEMVLTEVGVQSFRQELANSELFQTLVQEKAKESYHAINRYFQQEGLYENDEIGIVDTGWTGSMQRSIRQIQEHHGCKKKLTGFYFGMYNEGKEEDGEYKCFYFSPHSFFHRSARFNNNLLECMCAAEHGMTVGYKVKEAGRVCPVLKDGAPRWNVALQIEAVKEYTECFIRHTENQSLSGNMNMVQALLNSFMWNPSKKEAEVFGKIPFCDDPTESYERELACKISESDMARQMPVSKILTKYASSSPEKKYKESFWLAGTIVRFDFRHKKRKKFGLLISNELKWVRKKIIK